jgi:hypothetical protein
MLGKGHIQLIMVENILQKHIETLGCFAFFQNQTVHFQHCFAVYGNIFFNVRKGLSMGGHKKFCRQFFSIFQAFIIEFQTVIKGDFIFFQNMGTAEFIGSKHNIVRRTQAKHIQAVPGKRNNLKALWQGGVMLCTFLLS